LKKLFKVLNTTAITTCIGALVVGCGSDQQPIPEPVIENDPESDPRESEAEQEDKKRLSAVYKKYDKLKKGKINGRYLNWEVNKTITIFQDIGTHSNYFIDETNINNIKITEIKHGIDNYQKINNHLGFLFGDFSKNKSYKSNYGEIFLYDWRKPAGQQALKLDYRVSSMSNLSLSKINQDFYFFVDYYENSYLFNANAVSADEYFINLPDKWHKAGFREYFPINDNYGYITFYRPFIHNREWKLSAVIKFDPRTMTFVFENWFDFSLDVIQKINDKKLIGSLDEYMNLPDQIARNIVGKDATFISGNNGIKFIVYLEETDPEKQIEYLTKEVIDELKIKLTGKRLISIHVVNDHFILINNKILTSKTSDSYKTLLLDLKKPIGSRLTNLNIDICINQYQNIANHKIRIYNDDSKRYALLDLQQPIGKQISKWTSS